MANFPCFSIMFRCNNCIIIMTFMEKGIEIRRQYTWFVLCSDNGESYANQWQPNTDRGECNNCTEYFYLFCRRHHCRKCGNIFCKNCLTKEKVCSNNCIECYKSDLKYV